MAVKISKAELTRAANRAQSLQGRLANMKKRTEKVTERAVHTLEVGASAFAFGVLQGKTGGVELVGVPVELLAGVGLNLAGYLGLGGKMSNHLHGFGDGALAAYLTMMGRGVGMQWSQKEAGGGTGILEDRHSIGSIGRGVQAFSDEELARAAAEVQVG